MNMKRNMCVVLITQNIDLVDIKIPTKPLIFNLQKLQKPSNIITVLLSTVEHFYLNRFPQNYKLKH